MRIILSTVILSTVTMGACLNSIPVYAEFDGADVLEIEAEKAKKIEELEYKAKVLEQKAKLAKAYKEFQASGGYVPGDDLDSKAASFSPSEESSDSEQADEAPLSKIPVLKSISGDTATFVVKDKLFNGRKGSTLPGGYRVVWVSDQNGVRIRRNEEIFDLDIAWTQFK
ncbi:MAG: hypothetical protein MI976_21240 [Pseudomonadales bacterium]|nr:hypothetical protein [Pseudomonadales bacterium]